MIFILIFCLVLFRNWYTWNCFNYSRNAISQYCQDLIKNREYDLFFDYYNVMQTSYLKHFFNLSLWGKYSTVNIKYIDVLKPYIK